MARTLPGMWPARSGTVVLGQPSKRRGGPVAERPMRPTTLGAGERPLPRGGAVPAGSPVAEVEKVGRGKHRR
jgi:hypothetical protein